MQIFFPNFETFKLILQPTGTLPFFLYDNYIWQLRISLLLFFIIHNTLATMHEEWFQVCGEAVSSYEQVKLTASTPILIDKHLDSNSSGITKATMNGS